MVRSPSILAAVDGGVDRIVGINESTLVANKQGIFGEMFPASTKTRTVSGSDFVPNVETLLSLEPDVVIQWGDMGDEVIAPLENAGFKVIGLTYGTQEKLETWISLFGKITGNESRADELVSWMHAEKTAVSALVRGQQRTDQKVLYLRAAADGWTSYNGSGYMNFCTELVGGVNPAKDLKAASPTGVHGTDPGVGPRCTGRPARRLGARRRPRPRQRTRQPVVPAGSRPLATPRPPGSA
ncbi:ABC transporter substrate-binding protein [Streptomyces sp. NPDC058171]